MKVSASIDANESVYLTDAHRPDGADLYEATIFVHGNFDSGTVTIQASPDNGTTKINLRDVAGSVVSITENDVYNIRLGDGNKLGESIKLYATMAGSAESTTDVAVDVYDNL